jgi:hypothetical protein
MAVNYLVEGHVVLGNGNLRTLDLAGFYLFPLNISSKKEN